MPAKYEHHLPLHKPEEDADAAEAREATTRSLLAALPLEAIPPALSMTMPVAVAIPLPVAIPRNLAQPQGSQAQGSHDLVPAVTFFGEEEMPTSGGQVTDTLGSPGGTGGAYLNARAALTLQSLYAVRTLISPLFPNVCSGGVGVILGGMGSSLN